MKRVLARGQAAGERHAQAARERIVAAARAVPGVAATVEDDAVMLSGRGLVRRSVVDPSLHAIAGWGR